MTLRTYSNQTGHAILGLAVALSFTICAWAGEVAPAHIQAEIPQARLAGAGTFRWFGLKIYDAQLWVGANGYSEQQPLAEKFALDLRYARDLQGSKIAAASEEQMAKLEAGTAQQRASWKEDMIRLFPDVREGTHLTGVYLPDQGARFYLDGKPIGTIRDREFARAFFAIWLDPATTAPALRKALLQNAAPH
jgi:hypothetical protein